MDLGSLIPVNPKIQRVGGVWLNEAPEIHGNPAKLCGATPLFRYMSICKLRRLLEGQLFFPRLRTLWEEDPVEGNASNWEPYLAIAVESAVRIAEAENLIDRHEFDSIRDLLSPESSEPSSSELLERYERIVARIAERRAVLCFHGRGEEDMAMWKLYARDGVLIETTPELLGKVAYPADSYPLLQSIRYIQRKQDRCGSTTMQVLRPHFFKLHSYSYESEVRLALVVPDDKEMGVSVAVDPKHLITRVTLSPYFDSTQADAVKREIRALLPDVSIVHSVERNSDAARGSPILNRVD